MWRAKIFYNLFNYRKTNSNKIIKFTSSNKLKLQEQINDKIIDIEHKISESSKALVEAQIVKLRSSFSKSNNFIERIGKNVYKNKIEESINWHKKELKELYFKRNKLQITLEKIQGIYWQNQIKRFLKIIGISLFILLSIFIFLSGFMIVIYLLPLTILFLLVYSLATKKY
tara:strand:+ start:136 stop:648 length:513 start_codon:yes stop_codon:yes gene_type:complete